MINERLRSMLARWANILQEYDVEIKHRKGLKHMNADGLFNVLYNNDIKDAPATRFRATKTTRTPEWITAFPSRTAIL
jgi:hypothetical protein